MRPLILIVDDTPLARTTLRRTLEARGYHIVEAGSTAEAIRVYRDEWPDVVTMDMLMDGPNGIVAIQALQHIDHKAKIIVCSATSNPSFVSGALKLGVEAYLNKPVDPERLVAAIQKALAQRARLGSEQLAGAAAAVARGNAANPAEAIHSTVMRDKRAHDDAAVLTLAIERFETAGTAGGSAS